MIIPKGHNNLYGFFIILSMIISILYIYFSLKKENRITKNTYLYFLMYLLFSIIVGKMFTFITNPNTTNILNAGLSSYGGAIGVLLASIIFEMIESYNGYLIKYSILSLPLTYGISKLACFFAGCCYGIPYNGLFSVTYEETLNIPLFPIQLTETICFIILFNILNKHKEKKSIIYITIILSALLKLLLDFLRSEHLTKLITTNQVISILLIIGTTIVWTIKKSKTHA